MSFDISTDPSDPTKLYVDFWFAPVQAVPHITINMHVTPKIETWQDYFDSLKQTNFLKSISTSTQIYDSMQERYPGPYTVQQFYSPKRGCLDYKLVFDDPKYETLWKLKYP